MGPAVRRRPLRGVVLPRLYRRRDDVSARAPRSLRPDDDHWGRLRRRRRKKRRGAVEPQAAESAPGHRGPHGLHRPKGVAATPRRSRDDGRRKPRSVPGGDPVALRPLRCGLLWDAVRLGGGPGARGGRSVVPPVLRSDPLLRDSRRRAHRARRKDRRRAGPCLPLLRLRSPAGNVLLPLPRGLGLGELGPLPPNRDAPLFFLSAALSFCVEKGRKEPACLIFSLATRESL
mmetsp:Transcript_37429/g.120069  ORF Transcript_37429/g.120069 Transcript_37429/m.120069 type:complete len:231 (+) Transcript_37429:494-1186(+)